MRIPLLLLNDRSLIIAMGTSEKVIKHLLLLHVFWEKQMLVAHLSHHFQLWVALCALAFGLWILDSFNVANLSESIELPPSQLTKLHQQAESSAKGITGWGK